MKIHFIAIGGSAMHNLAIALHKKGFKVSGSDDEVFEPSKTRLRNYGLLPQKEGWQPELLNDSIDAVILGMHARIDNPELLRAQELGLKIYSYPEYLYEQTKNKFRIVIGGSHGKTSITSIIMHILRENGKKFDYMVGANLEGFETMVSLSDDADIAIFEGDEYLSSPIDRRPKFHLYHPHIALLSGIAWDHINVFPTFDNYVDQFRIFTQLIEPQGKLFYYDGDKELQHIVEGIRKDIQAKSYKEHPSVIRNDKTFLIHKDEEIAIEIFGNHNLQNILGAKLICNQLNIFDDDFYAAIRSFKGAARRLQTLASNNNCSVYYDFAHSPSKLKATTLAVKNQFDNRKLVAVMELHTFSSLKKEFLPQYKNCMSAADEAYVYFNPHTLLHKQLEPITEQQVANAFSSDNLKVFTNSDMLFEELYTKQWSGSNLLLMSSGNFSGKDIPDIANRIIENQP
ncbi:MAG: UDP-N-acetylmuramate--L-alanine ligase [Mangrovibacterium sp.]